jgi:hypothetical protein
MRESATVMSSSMILTRSLFEVHISVNVKNPSLHKYVVENDKILTAISEITGYSSFAVSQNVPNDSSRNFSLRVLSVFRPVSSS